MWPTIATTSLASIVRRAISALSTLFPNRLLNLKRPTSERSYFSFAKIESLRLLNTQFEPDPTIDKTLAEEDGIWLGEEKKEIVLKIASEVAGYFKRRKLIANQVLEKELEDGGLILSAKVGHLNQVLPIVRYWIPHIRIISPEGLQEELDQELKGYVGKAGNLA